MGRIDEHRGALRRRDRWLDYLSQHSGLPGPRGNLELVAACGEEADLTRAEELIATDDEFAVVCGLVALGRLLGEGDGGQERVLHARASDPRWRVREGVAMALQRAGDVDRERVFGIAERWALDPDPLVRRAAVAAVCEPRLLRTESCSMRSLALVDRVTAHLSTLPAAVRRDPGVRTLRQALGYAWSVAVAAYPTMGLPAFAELRGCDDVDVQWIVRENLKKSRLQRLLN
ncbi:MAG: HEAT repeat domain-containing protein [Actinobacteria bacterium]|nr:HEAT repeat domain-containing protein [Actinomycetota bacterium]